jgi:hypothetical protein
MRRLQRFVHHGPVVADQYEKLAQTPRYYF